MRSPWLLAMLAAAAGVIAAPGVAGAPAAAPAGAATFTLATQGRASAIHVDAVDAAVVRIAADLLAGDVEAVSGTRPVVRTGVPAAGTVIVAGTIGSSPLIDGLVARGLVDPGDTRGRWEAYRIVTVERPWPGVSRALVVMGGDRRGTAYGLLSLSRAIGVSPYVWWADVAPVRRATVTVPAASVQGSPSVRYRGIFINDEDWGLRPWSTKTYEPEKGNIGPRTYARVFELLLRLRANILWPAMHPGTVAFNQDAANAIEADRYAIVMGSSHAEPMLRNNVAEWNANAFGAWDYTTNADRIRRYWNERVRENGRFENMYTLGMRGVHDSGIVASKGKDSVALMEGILADQRAMLRSGVSSDLARVPQVFIPYKEVLDTYRKGLRVPEDVTLGWVDDNFGYIRQLSTPEERKRAGGAGVYYHVSYWGWPQDYLWLATTPLPLIRSEMGRAWDTDARRLWVLNVGDVKPSEVDMEYFLDLAYDYAGTGALDQRAYLRGWATRTFPGADAAGIADVLAESFRLGLVRKPEHMGFSDGDVGVQRTAFSPVAYGDEGAARLRDYRVIEARALAIEKALPAGQRDAFFELVLYPIVGAARVSEKMIEADRSYLAAWQGRSTAGLHAARSAAAEAAVHAATARFDAIGNGKWRHIVSDAPRLLSVFEGSPTGSATPNASAGIGVAVEGSVDALVNRPARAGANYADQVAVWRDAKAQPDRLPTFDRDGRTRRFIDIFTTGASPVVWSATASAPWVKPERRTGTVTGEDRLWIGIDPALAPPGAAEASVTIGGGADRYTVRIALAPATGRVPAGAFAERDGVVAFEAEHFARSSGTGWVVTPDLGRSGAAIETLAGLPSRDGVAGAPWVEYDVYTDAAKAMVKAVVTALPTFPLDATRKLRYAIAIDGAPPQVVAMDDRQWATDVTRNARYTSTDWTLDRRGHHVVRIWALDPALVLDKVTLDLGGLRRSYLGPPETRTDRR